MQILGVFQNIYPDGVMSITRALLISAVGFGVVFVILGIIAIFVKSMGAIFDTISAKKLAANAKSVRENIASIPVPATAPLPADTSAGSLKLVDVTEEEAAVIMAIVSNQSGIPLNRLQFNSIKLTEDKTK